MRDTSSQALSLMLLHLQRKGSTGYQGSSTLSVSLSCCVELTSVFRVADSSNSGRITFDEFVVFETRE